MKTIGIKLADGSFYPVLQDNTASEKKLDLTTANNNQTIVMVDLYRSATCSMEDAEYVDSLQIENLVAHPNGEPDITFTVSLDEDNKLSAKIVDSETGNQSKTSITLVSRTQEERLITDEYDISDSKEKKNEQVKKAGAGMGLLAAAAALREKEESRIDKTEVEFTPAADMEIEDSPVVEETTQEAIFEEPVPEETPFEEPVVEDEPAEVSVEEENFEIDIPVSEDILDETSVFEEEPVVEEMPVSEDIPDETSVFEEEPVVEEMPISEVSEVSENVSDDIDISEEIISDDTPAFDLDLPDFPEETISDEADNADDISITDNTLEGNPFAEVEDSISDEPASDDPFALPEDTLASTLDTIDSMDTIETTDENIISDDFDSFDIPEESSESSIFEESTAESFSDDSVSVNIPDDDFADSFDIPDVTSEEEITMENNDLPDDFFDMEEETTFNEEAPTGKGLSFTGLYDKETELGKSSTYEEPSKSKTKVPVIICIICAIICILATAFVLFIIPSKFNLLNKTEKEEVVEVPVQTAPEPVVELTPEPEPEPEPEPVPEAKEEEIVVIEKAEEVVPEQPPVAVEKPKDITYKIKWGDTLWDISETYYKNPWRYKYIARFNKIKNPDHIISGTYITIPAE